MSGIKHYLNQTGHEEVTWDFFARRSVWDNIEYTDIVEMLKQRFNLVELEDYTIEFFDVIEFYESPNQEIVKLMKLLGFKPTV